MEEQDFINDLRAGKQFAYGKLLDLFQQKVFATCISFVPNKEDAEDIAQEVFVEVFNSINKFKGIRNYQLGFTELPPINV